MKNNKELLFAIYRQNFHIGNQLAFTAKEAIKRYLISAGYTKIDLKKLNLEKKCLAIKALVDIHYIKFTYKISSDELLYQNKELNPIRKEVKYNILLSLLEEKKEFYADKYNKLIKNEICLYKNKNLPCLFTLKNSFEIREWLISLKCQLLEDEKDYKKIINNAILYGGKKLVY